MGCFSICFTTSKNRKLKKSVIPTTSSPSLNQGNENKCESVLFTVPTEESTNLGLLKPPISESRDNSEDQLINEGCDDKIVTVDIDVDTNADISIKEVEIPSVESKEGKEKNVNESGKLGFLVHLENEKERDKEEIGKLGVLVQIENEKEREKEHQDLGVNVEIENEEREKEPKKEDKDLEVHVETEIEKKIEREPKGEDQSLGVENRSDSSVSSYISYPPMHRYHNSVIDEDEDHVIVQEDSSESLFSLTIDPKRQSKSTPVEVDDKEVNSPLKINRSPELNTKSIGSCPNKSDLNSNIDPLLNPIENLSQWKILKAEPTPTLDHHQEKENVYLELEQEETNIPLSKEPSFKVSDQKGKVKADNNSAVTTSLSSWLIGPEKTPTVSKGDSQFSTGNSFAYSDEATSWKSFEDRPILGAWTIDEVRQISARSSPRKSPCRNPDEMPIIGTVGSYWSHTGQTADSSNIGGKSRRNREKKASSCHSTPTKTRLERGAAA